jgi:ATP-dependent helicase/nuclease subunit B
MFVFNIPFGASFLDALAGFVLGKGRAEGKSVFLPTRRSVREFKDAMLRASGKSVLVLPEIKALGEAGAGEAEQGTGEAERILTLAAMVRAKDPAMPYSRAYAMASDLAALIDTAEAEEVSLADLDGLVPDGYAEYWKQTLAFLKIASAYAAGHLDSPVRRRIAALDATRLSGNEIIAGSTGSIPYVARFMKRVLDAGGTVVLPGMDRALDDADFAAIGPDHAQYSIKNLLVRFGVRRADVRDLAEGSNALASAVMAPVKYWKNPALSGKNISVLELKTEFYEARAVAIAIRGAIEENMRVHLITPDRKLAKSVSAELGRWNISINDSAGRPATETQAGNFLMLALRAAMLDYPPMELLALLKSPLIRPELRVSEQVELAIRGVPGLDDIDSIISKCGLPALRKLPRMPGGEARLADWFRRHMDLARALSGPDITGGMDEISDVLARLEAELSSLPSGLDMASVQAYQAFVSDYLFKNAVRPAAGQTPGASILNSIEARLLPCDLMIMAGLNEGVFPAQDSDDPWLSRAMKAELGLPLPERKVGLASHDFAEFLCYPKVLLTRAITVDGIGRVASRWLAKLGAIRDTNGLDFDDAYADYIASVAENLDAPEKYSPVARPAPRPPAHMRPKSMHATGVEKWYRDPYIIFARYVLGLEKLDNIAPEISPADFGNVVHTALEEFKAKGLSSYDDLVSLMVRHASDYMNIDAMDFWQARFRRIARFVVEYEASLGAARTIAEAGGEMKVTDSFALKARADRIDLMPGGAVISDYKTGSAPTRVEMEAGYAPQLPLEAAIFGAGGFGGKGAVAELRVIELARGKVAKYPDAAALAARALDKLREVVMKFEDESTPYLSRPNPSKVGRAIEEYSEYSHLARVKEWNG